MEPSNLHLYQCEICKKPLNDSDIALRAVCPDNQNLCSKCIDNLPKNSQSNKKLLSQDPVNKDLPQVLQGMPKISDGICSSCQATATWLCLQCDKDKIQCNDCISKKHRFHTKYEFKSVPQALDEKENYLNEAIRELEASNSVEERNNSIERKENELKQQVHTYFEDCRRALNEQEEIVINKINQEFANFRDNFAAKNSQQKDKSECQVTKWINETKSLIRNENNRMMEITSLLCNLYKQEELLRALDMSQWDVRGAEEDQFLNQVLNQFVIRSDTVFLENFKKNNPVKFEHKKDNLHEEEEKVDPFSGSSAKKSRNDNSINNSSEDSKSQIGNSNHEDSEYQFEPFILNQDRNSLSPNHSRSQFQEQGSEWIKTGSKSEQDPLKEAFKNADLEVQVQRDKDSNGITLDSLKRSGQMNSPPSGGLKDDTELEKFYDILCISKLAPSLKRVISLNLTCARLTESGALHLSNVVDRLPSLEDLKVEFFHSGNLKHEDLNPFMQALGRSKNLSALSLSCKMWKHLKNRNLSATISDLVLMGKLKNLTLNFSECRSLTTIGIMEAFHGFSRLESLEYLKISFNRCDQVDDNQYCLESICHVYCEIPNLRKIEFEFLNCPHFTEKGAEYLRGDSKDHEKLIVQINGK